MDPSTLSTIGHDVFIGVSSEKLFTAHPHNLGSQLICAQINDRDGKVTFKEDLVFPGGEITHDCAVSLACRHGKNPYSSDITVNYVKWCIDPTSDSKDMIDPEFLLDVPCEFPRIDEWSSYEQRIILAFRLRSAVYGNWVDAERIPETEPFLAQGIPDIFPLLPIVKVEN
ncbi:hypothetical protein DER46DRAFT_573376 [Fusarium sp. MPI-SDFR-AT-0072]|nr:hypothetical protein DER46DRAFT_573376 [Fusarium sp. MPI-SDFR-AT-0072]